MVRWLFGGIGGIATVVVVGYGWAAHARDAVLGHTRDIPGVDVPVPWPLPPAEAAALPPGADATAIARERAVARGRHLVESRYGCMECHGADFAGGVMIDAAPMGKLLGPNITRGGVTAGWTGADWDRIVRHGVMHDGHTSVMPAIDFAMISDQELSDVIAFAGSLPPSDAQVPAPTFGPVMTMLIALGQIVPSADKIDHSAPRPTTPPDAGPTPAYGEHLAMGCRGCHGVSFAGGPIEGGDPAWPPAADITARGLDGWTFEAFDAAVRHGRARAGGEVRAPMPWRSYASMTDEEVQALWAFFQTVR